MALKEAPIVEVLKFDEADAYNHNRPISSLIRTQLLHLHHAEHLVVPPKARTNININNLLTELQASEYIEKMTALLHEYGKYKKVKARTDRKKKRNKSQGRSKSKVSMAKSKKVTKSGRKRGSRR